MDEIIGELLDMSKNSQACVMTGLREAGYPAMT